MFFALVRKGFFFTDPKDLKLPNNIGISGFKGFVKYIYGKIYLNMQEMEKAGFSDDAFTGVPVFQVLCLRPADFN